MRFFDVGAVGRVQPAFLQDARVKPALLQPCRADVGRTQERSEQSAIGGMVSIQGVGRVQPALFYAPVLFACPAAGCTRPTLSMRSSLQ